MEQRLLCAYPNIAAPLLSSRGLPQLGHEVFLHAGAQRSKPDQSSFNPESSNDSLPKNETIMAKDYYESLREAESRCVLGSLQPLLRAKPCFVFRFFKQQRTDRNWALSVTRKIS